MGLYCDKCGKKNIKGRANINIVGSNFPNEKYIIEHYDICNECYLKLYKKLYQTIYEV